MENNSTTTTASVTFTQANLTDGQLSTGVADSGHRWIQFRISGVSTIKWFGPTEVQAARDSWKAFMGRAVASGYFAVSQWAYLGSHRYNVTNYLGTKRAGCSWGTVCEVEAAAWAASLPLRVGVAA